MNTDWKFLIISSEMTIFSHLLLIINGQLVTHSKLERTQWSNIRKKTYILVINSRNSDHSRKSFVFLWTEWKTRIHDHVPVKSITWIIFLTEAFQYLKIGVKHRTPYFQTSTNSSWNSKNIPHVDFGLSIPSGCHPFIYIGQFPWM